MNEAGVLAATMNQPEVLVEGAVELEREVRRGVLSRRAQSSANFLAATEQSAEAEESHQLSVHAVAFLSSLVEHSPKGRPFLPSEVEPLVNGLLALRGPMKPRGSNSLDYEAALSALFSSTTVTYAAIATDIFGNSVQSTYNSLNGFAKRCAEAAYSQDISLETIEDIMIIGGTDADRPRVVQPDVVAAPVIERRQTPLASKTSMASVAMGPIFPPEPPKQAINNPYDFEESPVPRPRSTDDDNPLAWQVDALCAQTDPEAFFPEKGGSTRDAKRICAGCDVRGECLDYALQNDERFGIWGGLSERERRKLKRRA